ncbi:hypothetical protein P152DRAFT_472182 [Eremomyces bilateralis CBS 781.70]|uniref:Uncharacterized protein n=1 Tax=Eremomyces bilateralis CBS 781.70 TaxID=1392243 RepID=A0A6G1G8V2_9PEZI|nr:uncharacterized protein P152DRAFT_472182 [Eremomyces bilateralis CBS 781.70]KAF1814412.1 hypothetical protein P152DRAFT_472182 [Eremomyces bilateralis CBS 781.70]
MADPGQDIPAPTRVLFDAALVDNDVCDMPYIDHADSELARPENAANAVEQAVKLQKEYFSNSFLNGIQPHDWMSNEQSDFSSSKAAALQAEWPTIQTLLTAPAPPTSPSIKRPQTKGDTLFNLRTFTEQFKFPLKRLLEWPVGTGLNRVIFLFMHPQNEKEFEPVISALHSLDLEVYSLARPGSWRWFSNHYRSGVIIIQAEYVGQVGAIPDFRDFLKRSFNIWQFGASPMIRYQGIHRLFKKGQSMLMTDEMLTADPEQALLMINSIHDKHKRVWKYKRAVEEKEDAEIAAALKGAAQKEAAQKETRAARIEAAQYSVPKLVFRAGVIPWLIQHSRTATRDPSNMNELIKRIRELQIEYDPDHEKQPPHDIHHPDCCFVGVPLPRRNNGGKQRLTEPRTEQQVTDTDELVAWFAGWAIFQSKSIRRNVVLHPTAIPQWSTKYNHLIFISTNTELRDFLSLKPQ